MYAFIIDDDFTKGYLPIIRYKLLIGNNVRIGLTGCSSVPFHAPAVCMHFHLCSLMMMTLELTSSLAIKRCFLILESISYFVSNLIIKNFQFK